MLLFHTAPFKVCWQCLTIWLLGGRFILVSLSPASSCRQSVLHTSARFILLETSLASCRCPLSVMGSDSLFPPGWNPNSSNGPWGPTKIGSHLPPSSFPTQSDLHYPQQKPAATSRLVPQLCSICFSLLLMFSPTWKLPPPFYLVQTLLCFQGTSVPPSQVRILQEEPWKVRQDLESGF